MAGSITTLGVGSGLQLQDILDQLREIDQVAIDGKKDDIEALDIQLEEFTVVKNLLLTLKSSALDLSLSGTFTGRTVETSDEKIFTAEALDGATVKNTAIDVEKLAEQSSWLSDGFSSTTDSVAAVDGTFSYQVGGNVVSISVLAGTSLDALADLINDDAENPGITASVINTGEATPYKLLLQADGSGEDNRISMLAQLPDMVLTEDVNQGDVGDLNAQFTVDGISYQRQSNSFNDIIPSVTVNLKDAGKATLTVKSNDEELKEKITAFVAAYNEVTQELKTQSAYDSETGDFGILASTTLRDMPYELQGLMSAFGGGDSTKEIQSLFDLGMEFQRDGTITINQETLASAVSNSGDKVKLFFLGDPDNDVAGFADRVNDRLRTLTSGSGIVESEKTAAQSRIDDLEQYIEDQTARLDKRYEQLTKQFVELDKFMSEMTSMSAFLTGQFDSLANNWAGSSNN